MDYEERTMMYGLTRPQKLIYDMERFAGGAIAVVCGATARRCNRDTPELNSIHVSEIFDCL